MTAPQRLHALDAVRAFALFAGVVLHATMSFMPEFGWPIVDRSTSSVLAVVFYGIHQFRMTLFFLIAGFFARMLFHRRGTRTFIFDRLRRIGIPFVVGWIFVMPPIVLAVVLAVSQTPGGYKPPETPADPVFLAFPLTHLWFLYVLLWLYAATLLIRSVFVRFDSSGQLRKNIDSALHAVLTHPAGVCVVALPLCLALASKHNWPMWFGIPTPDQSLIPNLPATVAFTLAFGLGWLIQRQIQLLQVCERQWSVYLSIALVATLCCLYRVGVNPSFELGHQDVATLVYAAAYAVAVWSWTFALIGIGMKFCSEPKAWIRYLSDSSYWIYIIHMPVVMLAQAAMVRWELSWIVKFPLLLGVTLPLMLLSYHLLVRWTYIGWLLNGKMVPIFATHNKIETYANTKPAVESADCNGLPSQPSSTGLSDTARPIQ